MKQYLPERIRDYWPLLALLVIAALVYYYPEWQYHVSHYTGSYNCPPAGCPGGSAHNYNFWSGFGSDLGEYSIAGGMWGNVVVVWRAHTCHYTWWCWRHAAHPLEGTGYKLCHVHHPDERHGVKHAVRRYQRNKEVLEGT